MSRTKKTTVNSIVGLFCTIINSILSFFLRALFIRLLGLEYAGVNTLFADILSILNLADLGFNNAILFRLYKTISNSDDIATQMYLTLYKKICYVVGTFIGIIGLLCIPFLGSLIKNKPSFSEPLWSLYIIVLATTATNHFVNYKSILIIAKQERYILTFIQYICIFIRNLLQILSLAIWGSIYLYLLSGFVTTLIQGALNGTISYRRYHLTWNSKERIKKDEKKKIAKEVGALAVYKLCRTIDATIDTFLISKFIAITMTAIYGSTIMLLNALHELLGVFNDGMIASVGDLHASGNNENISRVFYQSIHFTFLLYGISTAILVALIPQFTIWWIGYSLSIGTVWLIMINFYMYGIGMNIATYRNAMGIFVKGWKRPAVTAVLNLIFSTILINKIGISGTILGTILARLITGTWYDPYIVIKYGIGEKPYKYYIRYILYIFIVLCDSVILIFLSNNVLLKSQSFGILLINGFVYLFVSILFIFTFGFLFPEQRALLDRIKEVLKSIIIQNVRTKSSDY